MVVLPLVLGWVALAAEPSPSVGFLPTGACAELVDLGQLALLRDPRVQPVLFSAPIWKEDGGTVIAEVVGPGVIQRIWLEPNETAKLSDGRLRIALDGKPALDISLEALVSGDHPHFPRPIVGEALGGLYCYVPIAFREGCRISVSNRSVEFFQIEGVKLPTAAGITTFTEVPSETDQANLKRAKALWKQPQLLCALEKPDKELTLPVESAEFPVDGTAKSTQLFALTAGPRTIRSFEVIPSIDTVDGWRSARLRIVWDGNDPAQPSVDVPLANAFGQSGRGLVYQSVLVGQIEQTWANRFPMPYHDRALVQIDAEAPIKGMLRVRSFPVVRPGSGYFRAAARRGGELNVTGRGHYAGTFVVAKGRLECEVKLVSDDIHLFTGPFVASFLNCTALDEAIIKYPGTWPLNGVPTVHHPPDAASLAAFRWRLADALPFARSLTIGWEGDAGAEAAAIDFWYSEKSGGR